jgi:hypothetical protein
MDNPAIIVYADFTVILPYRLGWRNPQLVGRPIHDVAWFANLFRGNKHKPKDNPMTLLNSRVGLSIVVLVAASLAVSAALADPPGVKFSKRCLMLNLNEGCAIADVNKDGKLDIIAGTHWYAAPDFIPRPVRDIPVFGGDYLATNGDHAYDVNGDGWVDVVSVGWMDKEICWYENPGADKLRKGYPWTRHVLGAIRGENEAIELHDIDGDGKPEIIVSCWNKAVPQVIYKFIKDAKGQPALKEFQIGPQGGHGYAIGDINGDGQEDILCESGWYEHPEGDAFAKPWKFHPEAAVPHAACPCIITKLTDSGRSDIIWARGHEYGIYWREQGEPKPDGTTTWTDHLIDKSWSQSHCLVWTDIDGDGQPELIAGKRVGAHTEGDPGGKDPECLYYYKWDKAARQFTRYTVAGLGEGVGGGMQIRVADLNGDGRPDIVVAGKSGTWILWNEGVGK